MAPLPTLHKGDKTLHHHRKNIKLASYVQVTQDMLNLFAACGRINYAKSARLYVQQMMSLGNLHPWLEDCFNNKKHAVRRSERY